MDYHVSCFDLQEGVLSELINVADNVSIPHHAPNTSGDDVQGRNPLITKYIIEYNPYLGFKGHLFLNADLGVRVEPVAGDVTAICEQLRGLRVAIVPYTDVSPVGDHI